MPIIQFTTNVDIADKKAFVAELSRVSLGNLSPTENAQYIKEFSDFFREKLNVAPERAYIDLRDPGLENIGARGVIASELMPTS